VTETAESPQEAQATLKAIFERLVRRIDVKGELKQAGPAECAVFVACAYNRLMKEQEIVDVLHGLGLSNPDIVAALHEAVFAARMGAA
jgi:hypothetical protein